MSYTSTISNELRYVATNESIAAVMHGLKANENDTILAICGSGDVPFALVGEVKKVIAVDCNPRQINFANERKEALYKRNYKYFLRSKKSMNGENNFTNNELELIKARNDYFEGKLKNIIDKLDSVEFFYVESIFKFCDEKNKFSKAYLSNISCSTNDLKNLRDSLLPGGLFYWTSPANNSDSIDFGKDVSGIKLEKNLTETARYFEHPASWKRKWKPMVYVKLEEMTK